MSQKKRTKAKPNKPFNFKALSKRDQLATIFSVETQILAEIGKVHATLTQMLRNQEAMMEAMVRQLDILANMDFLKQQLQERAKHGN